MLTIGAVIWLGGPPRGTPPRIRRLVVMNGTHPHVRFRNVLLNPRQTFKSLVHLHAAVPVGPEWVLSRHGYARMLKTIQRSDEKPIPPPEAEQYVAAWSTPRAFTSMINWYRAALRTFPPRLDEPRIRVPVLLIWGEQDCFLDRALAQESIDHGDQGRVVCFPDASHWVHHEKPDEVARRIQEFLG